MLEAHYLPPAKLGDILTLVREKKPQIIGLIDGYFAQTLSVWHKEILYALKEGVVVVGASSMGALRAAETHTFGMEGIGKIYALFQSGLLIDDDEVALVHAPKEHGYLNLSYPMVNIRFTLDLAAQKGQISEETAKHWTAIAKKLYYPNRTVEEIAQSGNFSPDERRLFSDLFSHHYVDQKKEDALLLLERISKNAIVPSKISEPLNHSSTFVELFHQDRRVKDTELTLRDLAKYIALHHGSFSQLRRAACNRMLVDVLAQMFSITATVEEMAVEKERFLLCHGLNMPHAFKMWLSDNDLTEDELNQLMLERARAQKLYASPIGASSSWRMHKAILEELKLSNQFTEWAEKAVASHATWQKAVPYYKETPDEALFDNEIFQDHLRHSSWDLDTSVKTWIEEAGFCSLQELVIELHKAQLARQPN